MDEGPAHRLLGRTGEVPTVAAARLEEGKVVDAPLAEHGFSVHLAIAKGGTTHRMLFDTGITPNGCPESLRRLGLDTGDVETVVLSHGRFDHTTGMTGLAEQLGRANLPVVIHPEFWNRRRIAIPGADPPPPPPPAAGP